MRNMAKATLTLRRFMMHFITADLLTKLADLTDLMIITKLTDL